MSQPVRRTRETQRYGTVKQMFTILCSMKKGACGSLRRYVLRTTRHSARKDQRIHRQSCFHWSAPAVIWEFMIQEQKNTNTSAHVSAHTTSCSPKMTTIHFGQAGVVKLLVGSM